MTSYRLNDFVYGVDVQPGNNGVFASACFNGDLYVFDIRDNKAGNNKIHLTCVFKLNYCIYCSAEGGETRGSIG